MYCVQRQNLHFHLSSTKSIIQNQNTRQLINKQSNYLCHRYEQNIQIAKHKSIYRLQKDNKKYKYFIRSHHQYLHDRATVQHASHYLRIIKQTESTNNMIEPYQVLSMNQLYGCKQTPSY
jgi:hypothetical protein